MKKGRKYIEPVTGRGDEKVKKREQQNKMFGIAAKKE